MAASRSSARLACRDRSSFCRGPEQFDLASSHMKASATTCCYVRMADRASYAPSTAVSLVRWTVNVAGLLVAQVSTMATGGA